MIANYGHLWNCYIALHSARAETVDELHGAAGGACNGGCERLRHVEAAGERCGGLGLVVVVRLCGVAKIKWSDELDASCDMMESITQL